MLRISPIQSKMARAALDWGVRDLARAAQVSTDTVSRLERGEVLKERTVNAIRRALEDAGVAFLAREGVRLQPTRPVASGAGNRTEPPLIAEPGKPMPEPRRPEMQRPPARGKSRLGQLRTSPEQSMTPVSHVR
jgi:transcriptional regulator with XRE-family HTH domain